MMSDHPLELRERFRGRIIGDANVACFLAEVDKLTYGARSKEGPTEAVLNPLMFCGQLAWTTPGSLFAPDKAKDQSQLEWIRRLFPGRFVATMSIVSVRDAIHLNGILARDWNKTKRFFALFEMLFSLFTYDADHLFSERLLLGQDSLIALATRLQPKQVREVFDLAQATFGIPVVGVMVETLAKVVGAAPTAVPMATTSAIFKLIGETISALVAAYTLSCRFNLSAVIEPLGEMIRTSSVRLPLGFDPLEPTKVIFIGT